MNCILIDPFDSINLWPLSSTKPVAALRIGILSIEEKWKNLLSCKTSYLSNSVLNRIYSTIIDDDNFLISGNKLPDSMLGNAILSLKKNTALYSADQEFIAVRLNYSDTLNLLDHYRNGNFSDWLKSITITTINTQLISIQHPWQIFQLNGSEIQNDFEILTKGRKSFAVSKDNQLLGDNLFVEDGAIIRCSILNSTTGPIYIGRDAEVMEGSIIRGPFALCENSSTKLGTKIYGPTTIGPNSKVGGELNNVVIQANSNKAHDGFLGNSVIGEWCNIGADSNNSNLKNTYSEVKLWSYKEQKFISTGTIFCGLIMGDHSKCGINTMFNTGTVVGVGANVFGAGFPRQFIPDFSWGGASGFTTFKFIEFVETAKAVMSRRNIDLSEPQISILEEIFKGSEKYRTWEK